MRAKDKTNLIRQMSMALTNRNTTMFLMYLEQLMINEDTEDKIMYILGWNASNLFNKFRNKSLTWAEVDVILKESDLTMRIGQ